jgi:hypothetical protein
VVVILVAFAFAMATGIVINVAITSPVSQRIIVVEDAITIPTNQSTVVAYDKPAPTEARRDSAAVPSVVTVDKLATFFIQVPRSVASAVIIAQCRCRQSDCHQHGKDGCQKPGPFFCKNHHQVLL